MLLKDFGASNPSRSQGGWETEYARQRETEGEVLIKGGVGGGREKGDGGGGERVRSGEGVRKLPLQKNGGQREGVGAETSLPQWESAPGN